MSLTVSEIFGPTFQGEGPSTGQVATFLRLGLCNLDCSWCDTPYTWDWTGKNGPPQDRTALERLTVDDVLARLPSAPLLVITGGEPLVQQRSFPELIDRWPGLVEIETNGTIVPDQAIALNPLVTFNVSPKLSHSGVAPDRAIVPDALAALASLPRSNFKFVCADPSDLTEVDDLVSHHAINPGAVWIMPEGRTIARLTVVAQALTEPTLARWYNLSGRLQVTLWGDERGH